MLAEDEHGQLLTEGLDRLQELQTARAVEAEAQHHKIPVCLAHALERLASRVRLADDGSVEVLLDQLDEAVADNGKSAGDEQPFHDHLSAGTGGPSAIPPPTVYLRAAQEGAHGRP